MALVSTPISSPFGLLFPRLHRLTSCVVSYDVFCLIPSSSLGSQPFVVLFALFALSSYFFIYRYFSAYRVPAPYLLRYSLPYYMLPTVDPHTALVITLRFEVIIRASALGLSCVLGLKQSPLPCRNCLAIRKIGFPKGTSKSNAAWV